MAGDIIRVIPKRTLDFTSVASGTPQAQELVLAQGIDISHWREVSLMVRTHTNAITQAVGKIEVYAYMEGRTEEDPGILFASTTALGTVLIDNTTVAPSYTVNSVGSNLGAMVKVAAKGTRTNTNATSNLIKAEISVDLSVKSA